MLARHPRDRIEEGIDARGKIMDLALQLREPAAGGLPPDVTFEDRHVTVTGAACGVLES
jgi:hypothetical protein